MTNQYAETLLSVRNLVKNFELRASKGIRKTQRVVQAVADVSFDVKVGQTLGLVGESGSGKTVTNLALMGLIPLRTANVRGSAIFESHDGPVDLLAMNRNDLRKY